MREVAGTRREQAHGGREDALELLLGRGLNCYERELEYHGRHSVSGTSVRAPPQCDGVRMKRGRAGEGRASARLVARAVTLEAGGHEGLAVAALQTLAVSFGVTALHLLLLAVAGMG